MVIQACVEYFLCQLSEIQLLAEVGLTPMAMERTGTSGSATEPDTPAAPLTFAQAVIVLDAIPGVDQQGVQQLVDR